MKLPLVSCYGQLTCQDSDPKFSASNMHGNRKAKREVARSAGLAANAHIQHDEELMLLASRRKLLTRSDWLALGPTRPLRLNFPAASDNDRVGRRKKIKKAPAKASKPAQQRLLTPLFEERLNLNAYMMSGALPPSSDGKIEIKVGTDAFDSQTCQSRRSRNASVGSQSAALSRLSEESMLLGADGDTFDANLVEVPPFHVRRERSVEPSEHADDITLYGVGRSTQATRGKSSAYIDQTELQQHAASPFTERFITTAEPSERTELPDDDFWADAPLDRQHCRISSPAGGTNSSNEMLELSHPDMINSANQSDPDLDVEHVWRRLMGIATQAASSASIKALNSLSEHVTTSGTPGTANPDRTGLFNMALSSPKSKRSYPREHDLEHSVIPSVEPLLPDELSVATAQAPEQPSNEIPEDESGEWLWRDFIIGSQDSESEDELHSAWQRKRKRRLSSSDRSQSLLLSGLGASDRATQGGTVARSSPLCETDVGFIESDRLHGGSENIGGPQNIHALSPVCQFHKKPKRRGANRPR